MKVCTWKPQVALKNEMSFIAVQENPHLFKFGFMWRTFSVSVLAVTSCSCLRLTTQNHSKHPQPIPVFLQSLRPIVAARAEAGGPQDTKNRDECFGTLWWSHLDLPTSHALHVIIRKWASHWLWVDPESYSERISHSALPAYQRHHHFDFSHPFPQGHVSLDSLDPRDIKTLGTSGKVVLILLLQMLEAGKVEVLFAESQTGILEQGAWWWNMLILFWVFHGSHFNVAVLSFVLLWGTATS